MNSDKAFALRDFINERSSRFNAEVLQFGSQNDQGWVIVADRAARGGCPAFMEPIADPGAYLRRAEEGSFSVDEEYRDLIRHWLSD